MTEIQNSKPVYDLEERAFQRKRLLAQVTQ
jgi:hypothetical protein